MDQGGKGEKLGLLLGSSGAGLLMSERDERGSNTIFGRIKTGSVLGSASVPVTRYSKSFVTGQKTVLTRGPTTATCHVTIPPLPSR
jgi:hypothetical protein